MTEHISILQGYIDHLEYMNKFADGFFDREQANKDIEAFKAAIKALEQEPCEDTMSRILKRMWNCRGKHTTSIDKVKMEQVLREELPPVNPQPKIGHWIMKHRTHNEIKHYTGQDEMGETHTISVLERYEADEPYCSECGKRAGDTSQNYCCECGAKMFEPQESEDRK